MKWLNKISVVALTSVCLVVLLGTVGVMRLIQSTSDHYGRTALGYAALTQAVSREDVGPVDLVDFYYYGCPHCNDFEAPLDAWVAHEGARVRIRRVPVGSDDVRVRQAHLYYALSSMGLAERFQSAIYLEIHQRGNALDTDAKILAWVKNQGLDIAQFARAYHSPAVEAERQAGIAELKRDEISTVPTVVVGTRWVVSPTTAGGIAAALDAMSGRVQATALSSSKVASGCDRVARCDLYR